MTFKAPSEARSAFAALSMWSRIFPKEKPLRTEIFAPFAPDTVCRLAFCLKSLDVGLLGTLNEASGFLWKFWTESRRTLIRGYERAVEDLLNIGN